MQQAIFVLCAVGQFGAGSGWTLCKRLEWRMTMDDWRDDAMNAIRLWARVTIMKIWNCTSKYGGKCLGRGRDIHVIIMLYGRALPFQGIELVTSIRRVSPATCLEHSSFASSLDSFHLEKKTQQKIPIESRFFPIFLLPSFHPRYKWWCSKDDELESIVFCFFAWDELHKKGNNRNEKKKQQ